MPIETRVRPYEILIRYGKDGLQHAHMIDVEEFFDPATGQVRSATELPARPVTKAQASTALGVANADAVEKVAMREAAIAKQLAEVKSMRADLYNAAAQLRAVADAIVAALPAE